MAYKTRKVINRMVHCIINSINRVVNHIEKKKGKGEVEHTHPDCDWTECVSQHMNEDH